MVTVLKKGSYFGEIGLLRTCRRTASIRAISETVDLFVLSKVPRPFSRAIFSFVTCSTTSEKRRTLPYLFLQGCAVHKQ